MLLVDFADGVIDEVAALALGLEAERFKACNASTRCNCDILEYLLLNDLTFAILEYDGQVYGASIIEVEDYRVYLVLRAIYGIHIVRCSPQSCKDHLVGVEGQLWYIVGIYERFLVGEHICTRLDATPRESAYARQGLHLH